MALFGDTARVENAVNALRLEGFSSSDISVVFPQPEGAGDFMHVNATKGPEGAAAGGTAGFLIGGALGWLAGIGTFVLPGFGPLIAMGPIIGLLAGAGAGGIVGGVAGALIGLGFPEYEAMRFESLIREGGYLLSVQCRAGERAARARALLERNGARDISTTTSSQAASGASHSA